MSALLDARQDVVALIARARTLYPKKSLAYEQVARGLGVTPSWLRSFAMAYRPIRLDHAVALRIEELTEAYDRICGRVQDNTELIRQQRRMIEGHIDVITADTHRQYTGADQSRPIVSGALPRVPKAGRAG